MCAKKGHVVLSKTIRFNILLIAVALIAVSCAKSLRAGGGIDSGGGDLRYSSKEQIHDLAEEVWLELTRSRASNPLVAAYLKLRQKNSSEPQILKMLARILSADGKDPADPTKPLGQKLTDLEITRYLSPKKIHYAEDRLCDGPNDRQFTASVTHLSRNGEICLSLLGLQSHPSGSLHDDIRALLIHEISHLNGYEETEARSIQDYFLRRPHTDKKVDFLRQMNLEILPSNFVTTFAIGKSYLTSLDHLADLLEDYNRTISANGWGSEEVLKALAIAKNSVNDLRLNIHENDKITAQILGEMRKTILSILEFQGSLSLKLFGNDPTLPEVIKFNDDLKKTYSEIMEATDPKRLTDPPPGGGTDGGGGNADGSEGSI